MNELTTRTVADVTRDIRIKTGQFLMDAIDIGRLLYEAKAMVEPGKWSEYIEKELPFSHSWANNYMRLYKELGREQMSLFGDPQALGNLRPTQALELLALPAQEREEFIATHDVENMSTRELKKAIRERDEAAARADTAESRLAELEAEHKVNAQALEKRVAALEKERSAAAQAEQAAREKAADLEKQLFAAREETEKAKKDPKIPEDMMQTLRREAEEAAAKKAEEQLRKKLDAAEAEAEKARQARETAEAAAREMQEKLEAAQKTAKISDPDLMAVQLLGQQLLKDWNVIMGHRLKAVQKDPANAEPLERFLGKLLETMRNGTRLEVTND